MKPGRTQRMVSTTLSAAQMRQVQQVAQTRHLAVSALIRQLIGKCSDRCINCGHPFSHDDVRCSFGSPADTVGPFCEACDHVIKAHTGFYSNGLREKS